MIPGASALHRFLFPFFVLVLVAIVLARLHMGGWSASHFIVHGEVFHHEASNTTAVAPVAEGGYDGQFFSRLAFNPFDVRKDAFGITLDKPAYRAQRMLFPFTGWVLSFGHSAVAPYTLIAVNVLSLLALFVLLTKLIQRIAPEANRLYVLIAVLLPGFLFGLSRNLSEPLGVVLAVAALLSLVHRRVVPAAMFFALATLVRETFCLTAFASGLWLLLFENPARSLNIRVRNMLILWCSIIPMLVWQGYLYTQLGTIGPLDSQGNMTFPLKGFFAQLLIWVGSPGGKAVANVVYLFWHIALAGLVMFLFARVKKSQDTIRPEQKLLALNWVVISLFLTLLSPLVWEDAWAFCRVLAEWSVLSILLVASMRPRLPLWLAGYSFALSGLSLVRILTRL